MRIEKYEIHLDLNDTGYGYEGTERIDLNADEETLVLNSVDLQIKKVSVNGKETPFLLDAVKEELSIGPVPAGNATVEIKFSGRISKSLTGFYLAKSEDGEIFTTQLESSGARRTFPCVDHPDYKARFSLSLTIREGLDAISNMPIRSVTKGVGKKTVYFDETPRMSTYLLYIGVGRFDERAAPYRDKEIILAAPKGHLTASDFPIEIAKGSLDTFEDYFAIDYMLPKMHLIAVPEFAAGAMENWGAITMREVYMDIGPSTSGRYRKVCAEVISHEIVHHWFGDLVTMKWWNDLWLNESFATFMAYMAVDRMFPAWDSWGDFVISRTNSALKDDSLVHTHPIDVEVKDPESVAQIFDEISYGKGGCILRMIESYVGKENFRDGIRGYLRKHAYDNATGKDLWNAIEEVSRQPIGKIMQAWIETEGYPLVTVTRRGGKLHLRQERFFLGEGKSEQQWPIPLTLIRKDKTENLFFEGREIEADGSDFLKLNVDQTGFYRVLYDEETLDHLLLNQNFLSNLDRWGIANDLYAFLISGRIRLAQYLTHIAAFVGESDRLIVEELTGQFSRLNLLLPNQKNLVRLFKSFLKKQLERLGERKEIEPENDTILRGMLSRERVLVDEEFADGLSGLFPAFQKTDPNVRSAIALAEAFVHNDFAALEKELRSSASDEDRTKLISAMGWLRGDENLARAVGLIRGEVIKKQDSYVFYLSASANPKAREFMLENLEFAVRQLQAVFVDTGTPSRILEQLIPLVGIGREDRILEKANKLNSPDIETGIKKGKEMLEIYSKLVKKAEKG